MKLAQVLDAHGTSLASDTKNQLILKELVMSERSITELASRLNIPTVTLWKRMQKLLAANMVEVSAVKKSGNLEVKMYRAAAARYLPAELLALRPSDGLLLKAFEVYSKTQNKSMAFLSKMNDIPADGNPVDYGFYVIMRAFVQVCKSPDFQSIVTELDDKLSRYEENHQAIVSKSQMP